MNRETKVQDAKCMRAVLTSLRWHGSLAVVLSPLDGVMVMYDSTRSALAEWTCDLMGLCWSRHGVSVDV